jgi:signal transduction histidine kinase/ActR/RegA family two-component response regulator
MIDQDRIPNRRILVIDDNRAIHEDFRKILCADSGQRLVDSFEATLLGEVEPPPSEAQYEIDSAFGGQEGLELVRQAVDDGRPYPVAFVDVRMPPGWDGIETVPQLWRVDPELQVVLCTAFSDYSWNEITRRLDRPDQFLILRKPFDIIEVRQLAGALSEKWRMARSLISRLTDLESMVADRTCELQDSLALSRATLEATADGILVVDLQGRILIHNRLFAEMWKIPKGILEAKDDNRALQYVLDQLTDPDSFLADVRTLYGRLDGIGEHLLEFKDGRVFERFSQPYRLGDRIVGRVWSFRDITRRHRAEDERGKMEEQLRQAQKMEAIGRLAGGIAHDFNNLLLVINGRCQLLLHRFPGESADRHAISEILKAGQRAASLTQQLLAFSRKQMLRPKATDLNELILETESMIRRLIGEDIELRSHLADDLWPIRVDPNQMVQVLLNLVVNSRDAMPRGGRLSLATANERVDADGGLPTREVEPGEYVCLTISDSGCGMDKSTLEHIFDPFYTTKEIGKGTGLGLAMVYGIVHQSTGGIRVRSEVNVGTTFELLFPRHLDSPRGSEDWEPERTAPRHPTNKRILIVEDEKGVRSLVRHMLESEGFVVLEALLPEDAIRIVDEDPSIDAVVTDVVMPGMNGRDLLRKIRDRRPDIRTLYMSGYTDERILEYGLQNTRTPFLQKPFSPETLLQAVHGLFDEQVSSEAATTGNPGEQLPK